MLQYNIVMQNERGFVQMTLEDLSNIIEHKINQNKDFIKFTFYELRVKHNLSEDDSNIAIKLIKQKLSNYGYNVYLTGEKYTYNSTESVVPTNILLIAIKSPTIKLKCTQNVRQKSNIWRCIF